MPRERQTITPALTVRKAEEAIQFYEKAFGAKLDGKPSRGPDGTLLHAEMTFYDTKIFLNDEFPARGCFSPAHYGGSPVVLQLKVPDVDKTYAAAVAAGAKSEMAPHDAFWGDRYAYVVDPFGYGWGLFAFQEDLTEAQVNERMQKFFREQKK